MLLVILVGQTIVFGEPEVINLYSPLPKDEVLISRVVEEYKMFRLAEPIIKKENLTRDFVWAIDQTVKAPHSTYPYDWLDPASLFYW